ncbi:MAG TPA: HDIG domain-containing protein [Gemmatimonadaceae bacterium]|nr:HDIG domain-containing protein [Gemmatimonadaceae bacterium]
MNLWQQLERAAAKGDGSGGAAGLRYHGVRVALALALALTTYALFPASPAVDFPLLEVGSVAPDNVIAPFAFDVPKAPTEIARERDEMSRSVVPAFVFRPSALDSARSALTAFASAIAQAAERAPARDVDRAAAVVGAAASAGVRLTPAEASYLAQPARRDAMLGALTRSFDRWLAAGVASSSALDAVRGAVNVRRGDSERAVAADSVPTFSSFVARARLLEPESNSPVADALYVKLLGAFFQPTLVYDRVATERRRQELTTAVNPQKYAVRAGEKIVGAHEVVGREEHEKMRALRDEVQRRDGAELAPGRILGAVLFNALVIAIFGVTLLLFRPQLYRSFRALAFFAIIFFLVLVAAALVAHGDPVHPELIPVALAAILFSVLFDPRISLIAAMVLAVLVGGQSAFRGTNALFINLIGGVAAAFGARVIRRRDEAFYPMASVAGAYLLAAVAIGLTLDWTAAEIGRSAVWGAANAVASVALALMLLPFAEKLTGIDTYPKLLEWSDLNRPLMQRLSLEAPGTYNHTIVMANLAEAACNAIGANGLLARVGAYYHDIGKLKKPQYFVENQAKGRNPHDKLKPGTSASIIRNHVREGVELAEEAGVPKAVRAFIAEHHGTGQISYFLEKARERDGGPVNPSEFAYPGPIPQTAETAVCMLADGVEASVRVLHDPTPQKIRDVIDHIVRQRIDQGQLRAAPLTLQQLETVKEQFARMLIAQHHSRIDYPASSGGVTAEFASA